MFFSVQFVCFVDESSIYVPYFPKDFNVGLLFSIWVMIFFNQILCKLKTFLTQTFVLFLVYAVNLIVLLLLLKGLHTIFIERFYFLDKQETRVLVHWFLKIDVSCHYFSYPTSRCIVPKLRTYITRNLHTGICLMDF